MGYNLNVINLKTKTTERVRPPLPLKKAPKKTLGMMNRIIQQDSPAPQSASWRIPVPQQLLLAVAVYC